MTAYRKLIEEQRLLLLSLLEHPVHGRSQLKTSWKYHAASAWSVVITESGGGTCTKFRLLGLS
jgi:hypothetical protein